MRAAGNVSMSVSGLLLMTPLLLCACATSASPPLARPVAVANPVAPPPSVSDTKKAAWFSLPLDAFAKKPIPSGKTVSIWATAYVAWPAIEDTSGVTMTGPGGQDLGVKLGARDFCNAGNESTVIIKRKAGDTVTLIVTGIAKKPFTNCHPFYKKYSELAVEFDRKTYRPAPTDAPYGVGRVSHWRLVPYRTVAVKRRGQFANGTVLFLKSLAGKPVMMPDGTTVTHDGYVVVGDVGKMKPDQLDFYKGPTRNQDVPFATSKDRLVDAVIVTDPAIIGPLQAEQHCICAAVKS